MGEWKKVILFDLTSKIGDGLHGTPKYDEIGDYYFVNGNNLSERKIILKSDTKRVNTEEFNKYKKPLSDKTILLGINGTIGNLAFYNGEKCVLGKSACYINVNENVIKEYLYYKFRSEDFQNFLVGIATGTTIQNVPLKGLREYSFPLPPLPEQQSIAAILSSLDDKIDLLHRQNKTLEALAETLFRQWFVEGAEYETIALGEVVQTTSGGTPSRSNDGYYIDGTIPWVKSKELNRSYIFETEEKITEYALQNSSTKKLPPYSVLIAMYGATVGEYAIIAREATCNQAVCALIPNDDYPYTFLYSFVRANFEYLRSIAVGSAQQNISQLLIKELTVPTNREILRDYHMKVEPMFNKIMSNCNQIQTLTHLRDTLLPKLMSGEVQVREE